MDSFADVLRDYLNELSDLRQRGASEDSIRDAFLRFLRAAFPRLQQADPILLEKHIPGMRVRRGFADALYADLIFECKKRLEEHSRADLPPFYGPGAVRVGSTVTDGSSGRRSAAESARGAIAPNSAGVRYPNEL